MPKIYRLKARTDRYRIGKKIPFNNKQGYKVDRTQPCENGDALICRKNQYYYAWHPKGCDWQFSIIRPDLRSEWEKIIEDFQSRRDDCETDEELLSEIIDLRDELEERLNNIPEPLQESSILNERIEELNELIG